MDRFTRFGTRNGDVNDFANINGNKLSTKVVILTIVCSEEIVEFTCAFEKYRVVSDSKS
jgi:hypothetical protein